MQVKGRSGACNLSCIFLLVLVGVFVVLGCGGKGVSGAGNDASEAADSGNSDAEWDGEAKDSGGEDAAGHVVYDAGGEAGVEPPELPELPVYSGGTCPVLIGGSTKATSVITGFVSSGVQRDLRFLVPSNYDGTEPWPLVFGWHWLNASSGSFVDDAELETAAPQMKMLFVLPEDKGGYAMDWPFVETWGAEEELVFFEDLLACVVEQYNIDRYRIYGMGVSAGGLWVTYLSTTERVAHLASIVSVSGGLGEEPYVWRMEYTPQPNKFPVMVIWGGPTDWLGISFQDASIRYRDELRADNHFVVQCVHDQGHAVPPFEPPSAGSPRFWAMWRFMLDHPLGTTVATSPYSQGLPWGYPEWCQVVP